MLPGRTIIWGKPLIGKPLASKPKVRMSMSQVDKHEEWCVHLWGTCRILRKDHIPCEMKLCVLKNEYNMKDCDGYIWSISNWEAPLSFLPISPFFIKANYPSNHLLQCFEGHSSTPGILRPLRWRWQPAPPNLSLSGFLTLEGNRSVLFPPRERLSLGNQGSLQAQGLPSCSPATHKHPLSRSCLDNGWHITLHDPCVHLR